MSTAAAAAAPVPNLASGLRPSVQGLAVWVEGPCILGYRTTQIKAPLTSSLPDARGKEGAPRLMSNMYPHSPGTGGHGPHSASRRACPDPPGYFSRWLRGPQRLSLQAGCLDSIHDRLPGRPALLGRSCLLPPPPRSACLAKQESDTENYYHCCLLKIALPDSH